MLKEDPVVSVLDTITDTFCTLGSIAALPMWTLLPDERSTSVKASASRDVCAVKELPDTTSNHDS